MSRCAAARVESLSCVGSRRASARAWRDCTQQQHRAPRRRSAASAPGAAQARDARRADRRGLRPPSRDLVRSTASAWCGCGESLPPPRSATVPLRRDPSGGGSSRRRISARDCASLAKISSPCRVVHCVHASILVRQNSFEYDAILLPFFAYRCQERRVVANGVRTIDHRDDRDEQKPPAIHRSPAGGSECPR